MKRKSRAGSYQVAEFAAALILFLCLAAFFVLNASNATSVLYPTYPVYELEKADQATFTIMGRYWIQDGVLPYTGLFDHKGPMIFLLDGLGWAITGSVCGIAVVQIVFVCAYCMIAYTAVRKRHKRLFSLAAVLFSLAMLRNVYGGGNTVEEFGLPFQMLSLMGLCRWAGSEQAEHSPSWAFFYGVSIAFFILNRATDAICICAGCVVVLIVLLKAKAYRNILMNALAGLMGIVLPILPFVIYFAAHHALDAMWYGMIGYNMEYAGGAASFWMIGMSMKEIIEVLIYCIPIWSVLLVGAYAVFLRKWRKAGLYIVLSVVSVWYLFTSRFYDHYVITYVPLFILAACECEWNRIRELRLLPRSIAVLAAVSMLAASSALAVRMEWNTRHDYKWSCVNEEKPYDTLMRMIPEDELDSVVLYNCIASIYLKYDFCPAYTYFALQDWQGSQSAKLMGMIEEEFASCEAKWVMTHGGTSANILSILENNYEQVMEKEKYVLYRRL